uniref:Uncharacterized protein n=1 Tax=Anguilla anguilla TaxID=7936 RepID=A0A0E9QSY9_ANGAN
MQKRCLFHRIFAHCCCFYPQR